MSELDTINRMQREYDELMTEIRRMQESSQFFTCRGYEHCDRFLMTAIRVAEKTAKRKKYELLREQCFLEQKIHVEAITYDAENER